MLLFKKRFIAFIRSGQKTQTIRLWTHRRLRAGQRSYIPGAGYIRVECVDEVALDELTEADAPPDGFSSLNELRAELARLYEGPSAAGCRAYRVKFRLLSPEEQVAARAERQKAKESGRNTPPRQPHRSEKASNPDL